MKRATETAPLLEDEVASERLATEESVENDDVVGEIRRRKRAARRVIADDDEEKSLAPAAAAAELPSGSAAAVSIPASVPESTEASLIKSLVLADRFCWITTQTSPLAILGTCLADLFLSLRIVVSGEGISASCMDPSQTYMARWTLRAAEMVEGIFRPPVCDGGVQEIVVDMKSFAAYLEACNKASVMRLSLDSDANPDRMLFSSIEGKICGNFAMQLNMADEPLNIGNLVYKNQVTLRDFWGVLRNKVDKNVVRFSLDARNFGLTLFNNTGELSYTWALDAKEDTVNPDFVQSPVTIQLKVLKGIMRLSKACSFVSISMPEYYERTDQNGVTVADRSKGAITKPLCITATVGAIGTVCFLISPQIEDADL